MSKLKENTETKRIGSIGIAFRDLEGTRSIVARDGTREPSGPADRRPTEPKLVHLLESKLTSRSPNGHPFKSV